MILFFFVAHVYGKLIDSAERLFTILHVVHINSRRFDDAFKTKTDLKRNEIKKKSNKQKWNKNAILIFYHFARIHSVDGWHKIWCFKRSLISNNVNKFRWRRQNQNKRNLNKFRRKIITSAHTLSPYGNVSCLSIRIEKLRHFSKRKRIK